MDLNEAQTRRRIIDKRLALAGWDVRDAAQVTQELDIDLHGSHSTADEFAGSALHPDNPFAGHQFADYALRLHGKPVAVIEAKRTMRDAEVGREQALGSSRIFQSDGTIAYRNNHGLVQWLGSAVAGCVHRVAYKIVTRPVCAWSA